MEWRFKTVTGLITSIAKSNRQEKSLTDNELNYKNGGEGRGGGGRGGEGGEWRIYNDSKYYSNIRFSYHQIHLKILFVRGFSYHSFPVLVLQFVEYLKCNAVC